MRKGKLIEDISVNEYIIKKNTKKSVYEDILYELSKNYKEKQINGDTYFIDTDGKAVAKNTDKAIFMC